MLSSFPDLPQNTTIRAMEAVALEGRMRLDQISQVLLIPFELAPQLSYLGRQLYPKDSATRPKSRPSAKSKAKAKAKVRAKQEPTSPKKRQRTK